MTLSQAGLTRLCAQLPALDSAGANAPLIF
jgi:hypothetical protein